LRYHGGAATSSWNLLEPTLRRTDSDDLAVVLRDELERLEIALERREPIATGLRYLAKQFPKFGA
jgi:hypothetical protein